MRADIQAQLQLPRNLPSPPGVALRILQLAQDPDVQMAAAADVIAMDAALSARMLRIANSPLYASRRRVDNLSQALTLLGLNATLTLALGFSIAQGMREDSAQQQQRLWRGNVIAALAARLLGEHMKLPRLEELMLAGLLQDIGMLLLLRLLPEEYPTLLAQARDQAHLQALEREQLQCSHAELGAWLARDWQLPALLQSAIAHSEPASASTPFEACVATAACFAPLWLDDDGPRAHEQLLEVARDLLQLDSSAVDALITQVDALLPDISQMFDVSIPQPQAIEAIIEQARELLVVRNLIEIQGAARARQDADELALKAQQLDEAARRDPLTGVFNRSQLDKVLSQEFEAAQRHGRPLSVAFVDLDDFKLINDRWGHLVGDQVLQNFAQLLQKNLRGSDVVARYGGEEFLVVLPGTDDQLALKVLQRVLRQIAGEPMVKVQQQPIHVTFSAGLATQGTVERFADAQALLKAADEALYGAKREGRNRVRAVTSDGQ
ncbi:sensor domain-containing diguanylate cyclase [Pseudoxanthomonas dokdonensis]|uniref:diguanylate cyclase n=1 Tax=Pseudoxanthomonas dokdonensis TaxID=344882 RepID=A0A0R0CGU1_9GAMM|nr:GGDEF domain-containing protein [Pseudoxanthomonas dokdonensis]KRG69033.1 diguanylate cyclase [Pseudoxanthomonas dokdonensis]